MIVDNNNTKKKERVNINKSDVIFFLMVVIVFLIQTEKKNYKSRLLRVYIPIYIYIQHYLSQQKDRYNNSFLMKVHICNLYFRFNKTTTKEKMSKNNLTF